MMRVNVRGLGKLLAFGAFALQAVSCDKTDASGACDPAQQDPYGEQYYLRIYNCVPEKGLVLVNGRQVGEIPAYDFENNVCMGADFGIFPQCNNGEVEVTTANTESFIVGWTEEAVSVSTEQCWLVFLYGDRPPESELGGIDQLEAGTIQCASQLMDGLEEAEAP